MGNVHLKDAVTESKSVIKTKNERVVGRNKFQRARPCKGAELTPCYGQAGREKLGLGID